MPRSRLRLLVAASSCLALGLQPSCKAVRPDVEGAIAHSTGVEGAITFRVAGEPVNGLPLNEKTLDMAQAVRLTLMHDPRIQSAIGRVRVAEAEANQARLLPNPILGIDVRIPTASGSNTAFEATLTADLVSLLQKPSQISAADDRLRAAAEDALTATLDILAEVQTAFATACSMDVQVENARRRAALLERIRQIVADRFEAGEVPELDRITTDSQIVQSELDLADLDLQRTEQRLLLARLIGQPQSDLNLVLVADAAPRSVQGSEAAWVENGLAKRPEIRSKIWELLALGEDQSSAAIAPFTGGDLGAHFEHDPDWRVGPTLNIPLPIFDFGQASAERISAQRAVARHELVQREREVIQEIRFAHASYTVATRSLTMAESKLAPIQNRQLKQAQAAYRSGEVDLTTLLLAEVDYQLCLSRIAQLQDRVRQARIKLERAAGGPGVSRGLASSTLPTSRPTELPTTQEAR